MSAKILVVDNEPDVLKSTQMILEGLGYEAVILSDPRQLPQVAEKNAVDAVLLDLVMPGANPSSTISRLRRNPSTGNVPIVLFSASSELAQQAADLDVEGYLQKPFSEQELFSMLHKILGSKAIQARSASQPMTEVVAKQEREGERQVVRAYFHDYWNLLTALNNYAQYLSTQPGLKPSQREAAQEISRLVLDLEKKTDALRASLLEYVG